MASSSLNLSGAVWGLAEGNFTIGPLSIAVGTAYADVAVVLTVGANTITAPAGAKTLIFVPDSANTQTLILKGVTGDQGVNLSKTLPQVWSWDVAATPSGSGATFVITAGGTVNGRMIFL